MGSLSQEHGCEHFFPLQCIGREKKKFRREVVLTEGSVCVTPCLLLLFRGLRSAGKSMGDMLPIFRSLAGVAVSHLSLVLFIEVQVVYRPTAAFAFAFGPVASPPH